MDDVRNVTINAVRTVGDGLLVADIDVYDHAHLETIWLKGRFGPQNGAMSLVKASGDGDIEGKTFTVQKIPSEVSPAGYAFRWTLHTADNDE